MDHASKGEACEANHDARRFGNCGLEDGGGADGSAVRRGLCEDEGQSGREGSPARAAERAWRPFPDTLRLRKPGVFVTTVIAVLAKVPKQLFPKVRLVGLLRLNENEGKDCMGMPTKMPVCEVVETKFPIVKSRGRVDVARGRAVGSWGADVGDGLGIEVVACTPLARARQIAAAERPKRSTGRIANSF